MTVLSEIGTGPKYVYHRFTHVHTHTNTYTLFARREGCSSIELIITGQCRWRKHSNKWGTIGRDVVRAEIRKDSKKARAFDLMWLTKKLTELTKKGIYLHSLSLPFWAFLLHRHGQPHEKQSISNLIENMVLTQSIFTSLTILCSFI